MIKASNLSIIFHKTFYLLKISTNWRLFWLYQTFSLLFYLHIVIVKDPERYGNKRSKKTKNIKLLEKQVQLYPFEHS
jgi:hypothetical protein